MNRKPMAVTHQFSTTLVMLVIDAISAAHRFVQRKGIIEYFTSAQSFENMLQCIECAETTVRSDWSTVRVFKSTNQDSPFMPLSDLLDALKAEVATAAKTKNGPQTKPHYELYFAELCKVTAKVSKAAHCMNVEEEANVDKLGSPADERPIATIAQATQRTQVSVLPRSRPLHCVFTLRRRLQMDLHCTRKKPNDWTLSLPM